MYLLFLYFEYLCICTFGISNLCVFVFCILLFLKFSAIIICAVFSFGIRCIYLLPFCVLNFCLFVFLFSKYLYFCILNICIFVIFVFLKLSALVNWADPSPGIGRIYVINRKLPLHSCTLALSSHLLVH